MRAGQQPVFLLILLRGSDMAEQGHEQEDNRLSTMVALLIAAVSVVGAVVAWRASVSGDGAGDADVAGVRATINLTETEALAAVKGYSDYASFIDYYKYRETGNLIEGGAEELANELSEEELEGIAKELADTYDLTTASSLAFPNDFLNRDGTYAIERQKGEYVATVSREKDINPQPSFDEADALRGQTDRLLIALSVLAVALVFYTLLEATESKMIKYLLLAGGTLFFLAGAVAAFLVETGRM
jgi:hypothetical protein